MRRFRTLQLGLPVIRPVFDPPTYPEYLELLAAAEVADRANGHFVDPAKWHAFEHLRRGNDWLIAVIGHSDKRAASRVEMLVALLADQRGIDPPMPQWLADKRAAQAAERDAAEAAYRERQRLLDGEWQALREALPVPSVAAYNYSGPGHYEWYNSGANHILLRADLASGRLRRQTGDCLCTTPSNTRSQIFIDPGDSDDGRLPSCKTCLRIASRLTGVQTPTLLNLINQSAGPGSRSDRRRWSR